ncbi:hypothetical protein [Mycobacterium palustre]|uniref:hypothetical protein n=1 Tax=Mycobacterium palustre TaxID=153971 RepID=UPI00114F3324|nr:hypothetical protein [Mycobacterium palustre]MCV7102824.1 hypothetical protein [Mycobacterium palustre]
MAAAEKKSMLSGSDGYDGSRSSSVFLRLRGTRNLALAAAPLVRDRRSRAQLLKVASACDLGDIVAVGASRRRGMICGLSAALFTFASAGVWR